MLRYASFAVLASAVADAHGALPADVLRVGGTGTAFTKSAHRHEFTYDPKPGYLYVRSRAISSRTNDNFDTFPAHAIKQAWATFIGKPVFVNHHNSDHRRMRGAIIDAALHEDTAPDGSPDTWVEVLMEVDAVRFPKLAEAVVKGHIDRTSMGTEVMLSTCSYCGNQAANPAEYCRHIPAMKGQRITRTTASGTKESVLVSEICEGLHFFENSLLVEPPADPTAFTFGVDTRGLAAEPTTARLVTASARTASLRAVLAEQAADTVPSEYEWIEAEAALAADTSNKVLRYYSQSGNGSGPQIVVEFPVGTDRKQALQRAKGKYSMEYGWLPIGLSFKAVVEDKDAPTGDRMVIQGSVQADWKPQSCTQCSRPVAPGSVLCPTHRWIRDNQEKPSPFLTDEEIDRIQAKHPDMAFAASRRTAAALYGPTKRENLGRCYELSGKRVAFGPDGTMFGGYKGATLVHGTIQGYNNPAIGHGWVEEPDGESVWEPATDTVYPKSVFKALFHPVVQHRYSTTEARSQMFEHEHFGPWDEDSLAMHGSRRTALGEQTAPAQVDTLRIEACPVCGTEDSFNGQKCTTCQYIKPPALFDDPDLERAKQVDLRGGDASEGGEQAPAEQLQCDNCDATFPVATKAKASTTETAPAKPGLTSTSALPDADPKAAPSAPDDETKAKPGQSPQDAEQDDQEQDDQPLAAGDECPTCGVGILEQVPAAPAGAEAVPASGAQDGDQAAVADPAQNPVPDPAAKPGEKPVDPQAAPAKDPGVGERDPNQPTDPAQEAAKPDKARHPEMGDDDDPSQQPQPAKKDNPFAKGDDDAKDGDPKDDEQDSDDDQSKDDDSKDGDKKDLPPWLKKKKTSSHRAGSPTEGREVGMGTPNPAQQNRNRILEAMRSQQSQIQAQAGVISDLQRAMVTMAKAAGVSSHPHFASLVTAADEEKREVATTDEQALKPAAKDDPESIGAVPSSANTGVTPDATTDVSNSNVALPAEPFNNLVDVTEPVAGAQDVPKGQAAHVETDVRVSAPSQEPFPNNSGWTTSSVKEDPALRLMASLRLAKVRKEAGLDAEVEELTLGQSIASDASKPLAQIQAEINVLAEVKTATVKAPQQRVAAARSLVPQRAAEVNRTVPSLSATAGVGQATASAGGEDVLADSLI